MEAGQQKGVKYILCRYPSSSRSIFLLHHANMLGLRQLCLTKIFALQLFPAFLQPPLSYNAVISIIKASFCSFFSTFSPGQNKSQY